MMRTSLTVVLLLVAVSGCGKSGKTTGSAPVDGKTVLTFWHIMNYAGPREVLDDAVRRFEQANPDTRVEVQTFDNDAYKTKLAVEMASGSPPDVFFTWGGGSLGTLADAGRVRELTAALDAAGWRERIRAPALALCTHNDRVFAVPLDLSCVLLWYNKALFTRLGLQPPSTLSDLETVAGKLKGAGVTPFALGNLKQWPGAFYYIYLAARQGGARRFLDAAARRGERGFNDPAFVTAGERLQRLVEQGCFPIGFNGTDDAQARTQFLAEQAGMYLMGTWLVARIKTENAEFLDKLACAPFPSVPGGTGDPSTVVGGVNCAFAVSAQCRAPEKAEVLLRFLTDQETVRKWCEIGRIPALEATDTDLDALPAATRSALEHLSAATVLQPYYDQYLEPRLAEMHKKTTQEMLGGSMSPAEAAKMMEACARESAE